MMHIQFDLPDVFIALNIGTAVVATALGLLLGAMFFTDRRTARPYLVALYTIGLTFVTSIGSIRLFQNGPVWETWIGVAILWTIFSIGVALGAFIGTKTKGPK